MKEIYEDMYGKPGSDKDVPKRERMKELSDIMEEKVFLVIVEGHNEDPVCDSSALFVHIEAEY